MYFDVYKLGCNDFLGRRDTGKEEEGLILKREFFFVRNVFPSLIAIFCYPGFSIDYRGFDRCPLMGTI